MGRDYHLIICTVAAAGRCVVGLLAGETGSDSAKSGGPYISSGVRLSGI